MALFRNWMQKSIRHRIIVPAAILFFVFGILQMFITFGFGRTAITYLIYKKDFHITQTYIKTIDEFFQSLRDRVYKNRGIYETNIFLKNEDKHMAMDINEKFVKILYSIYKDARGTIRTMYFLDLNYRPHIVIGQDETGETQVYTNPNIPGRYFLTRAKWDSAVHKALAWHKMGVSPVKRGEDPDKSLTSEFILPLIDLNWKWKFYFVFEIDLKPLLTKLAEYNLEKETITIFDEKDTIVITTSPDPAGLLTRKNIDKVKNGYTGITSYNENNTAYTATYTPVNNYLNWSCVVETNASDHFAFFINIQVASVFLMVVSFLSMLFLLSMIIKEDLYPVELLSSQADKIAKLGRLSDDEIKEIHKCDCGTGEISILVNSFSDMVQTLKEAEKKAREEQEKRQQHEQLMIQQSKLAAMGEMISMIAHQWRQPLSSISTIAGNIKVFLDLDEINKDEVSRLLETINDQSQFLSKTINDFRNFFTLNPRKKTSTIIEIMEKTLGIIGKSLDYKNIKVEKDFRSDTELYVNPNELMQVFLNILKNAYDALVQGKTNKPKISISIFEQNGNQVIEIEDNGPGIPESLRAKIFIPYFSTKKETEGTGLGLYISKTIITEHHKGEIYVKEKTGGSCFVIKLPIKKLNEGALE